MAHVGHLVAHVTRAESTPVERPSAGNEQLEPGAAGYQLIQHGRHVDISPPVHFQVVQNEKH